MYDVLKDKVGGWGTAPSVCIVSRYGDIWLVLDLLTSDLRLQNQRHLNNVSRVSRSTGRNMFSWSCLLQIWVSCVLYALLFFFENILLFTLEFQSGASTWLIWPWKTWLGLHTKYMNIDLNLPLGQTWAWSFKTSPQRLDLGHYFYKHVCFQ